MNSDTDFTPAEMPYAALVDELAQARSTLLAAGQDMPSVIDAVFGRLADLIAELPSSFGHGGH